VIGLANAGADTTNAIKQAHEFGITDQGQTLAGLLIFLSDIDALGLQIAQGLVLTESFYWDLTPETRDWSEKFRQRTGKMPTMVQAGVYSGVRHYLKAIAATGTDDGPKVAQKMRETPVNDMFSKDVKIYPNGRVARDFYVFQVKKPEESKGRWDDYRVLRTIPGAEAARKPEESGCPLVK